MPPGWFSLRKSLHCRSNPSDVHEPKVFNNNASILSSLPTKKKASGCSRSISNLRDVINGSKRYTEKAPSCSPRSIGSSDFLNPITHEVVFSNSACEIKITSLIGTQEGSKNGNAVVAAAGGGTSGQEFLGTVRPGTPVPPIGPSNNNNGEQRSFPGRRGSFGLNTGGMLPPKPRASFRADCTSNGSFSNCHKCGEKFAKWEFLETHHLSNHAVTELVEGDSSRKIVEMICRTGWQKTSENSNQIERILKVHNMSKTVSQFEEYRESVKVKASKLQKKHPRCLADGNELLRFHGTTVDCSIGEKGSSSVCVSEDCGVCQILKNGFVTKKEGVFTTSTSGSALEGAESSDGGGEHQQRKKALVVCRVVAGRVHRALENLDEMVGQTGFDSVAGKMGVYSNIEELYLLNTKALLPCFVVIFKP
ncbi:uncharacterized protein LOC124921235 [Impatiens glandulifera]|uniref:uncharacterized protein LOC124921235 n=1 Tax=Impatiens glandulifera TaxID=253017 RepID=UPI001FB16A49|nr:uncharacterized protein LOC124921235 [Impatiens glandulifera]